jgi:hypothetical protein
MNGDGQFAMKLKAAVTLAVLALTLLLVLAREKHWEFRRVAASVLKPPRLETPQDALYKMLDAARAGDTKAYLDCFTGELRQNLSQVIKEKSARDFSKFLTAQNSAFTGVAVSVIENPDIANTRLRVEYIYPGRNEVQTVYLRRDEEKWKIFEVTGSEQIKTLIPFGTRVTE